MNQFITVGIDHINISDVDKRRLIWNIKVAFSPLSMLCRSKILFGASKNKIFILNQSFLELK